MELIKKICSGYFDEKETEEKDSPEYQKQSDKCGKLFEELSDSLDEKQKKKLCNLDIEYFMLSGIWKDESFSEGCEKGFKLAIKLILNSLQG